MGRIELEIKCCSDNHSLSDATRVFVDRWKFYDSMMGEQYVMFSISSDIPIDWHVGDYCIFRGETYTLNYVPSVTQKARTGSSREAYTYDNVKLESYQEELTRCLMLDITPTTDLYVSAYGTNYTGSSKFTLFCGEVAMTSQQTGQETVLTAVCALVAKMQANLDRMYGSGKWIISVDTEHTYNNATGDEVLMTHTDDKVVSFDNTSVAKALEEVHSTFGLNYCVRGRHIEIGYSLRNLTHDDENETFSFGYGRGYPTRESMNCGLFQIKRIANSQQQIVTRLRAIGSTKNMPYRYYQRKFNLSQSLVSNLQLPDTFSTPATKSINNNVRRNTYGSDPVSGLPYLRYVKGDTNDSYIDKNDDASACAEGIREYCARFDGSDGDLSEIYPTIDGVTYGELRSAGVSDQDGNTSGSVSDYFCGYENNERIDKLLAVGYYDGGTLIDDANKGDGIRPQSGISSDGISRYARIGKSAVKYYPSNYGEFTYSGGILLGIEKTLFSIQGVMPGSYMMVPTPGSVIYGFMISSYRDGISADVGFIIHVKQRNLQTGGLSILATYTSDFVHVERGGTATEVELPSLPDGLQVSHLTVTALSDIIVTFTPTMRDVVVPTGFTDYFSLSYEVDNSRNDTTIGYEPEYTWKPASNSDSLDDEFHVFVQDMGFDFEACWSYDTPVMSMKSGRCVGREFEILEDVQKVTYNGKKGYVLTLKRFEDNSLNTYYPNETDQICAGDHFVLLGIQMPDAYVKAAEVRLLRAASNYLADNCETKFTYQPSIDDIYLQRNYDNMVKAGTPENSIFWRLYAGLKFTFRGVPSDKYSTAPTANITIEKVTISMGEGLTPKVELTLNDDLQQGTIQKLTTSVDRIYNGSVFNGGMTGSSSSGMSAALLSLLQSEGKKLFLSRTNEDAASGEIGFFKGLWVKAKKLFGIDGNGNARVSDLRVAGTSMFHGSGTVEGDFDIEGLLTSLRARMNDIQSSDFNGSGMMNAGWCLTNNKDGHSYMEIDELLVRMKATFLELEIRKESYSGGNVFYSPAGSVIYRVDYLDDSGNVIGQTTMDLLLLDVDETMLTDISTSPSPRLLTMRERLSNSVPSSVDVATFRCYLVADDGTTRTRNWWAENDQARCQTFNRAPQSGPDMKSPTDSSDYVDPEFDLDENGESSFIPSVLDGNVFYWRLVTGVGTELLEDGKLYDYVDLSNRNPGSGYLLGSDVPVAGDTIVCMGNRTNPERMGMLMMETIGPDSPSYKIFRGINTFSLVGCMSGCFSPSRVLMDSNNFKWITNNGAIVPNKFYLGMWQTGMRCHYYEEVSHDGSIWLCKVSDGYRWEDSNGDIYADIPISSSPKYMGTFQYLFVYNSQEYSGTDKYYGLTEDPVSHALLYLVRNYTDSMPSSQLVSEWEEEVKKGDPGDIDETELAALVEEKVESLGQAIKDGLTITVVPNTFFINQDSASNIDFGSGWTGPDSYKYVSEVRVYRGGVSSEFSLSVVQGEYASARVFNNNKQGQIAMTGIQQVQGQDSTYHYATNNGLLHIVLTVDGKNYDLCISWFLNELGKRITEVMGDVATIYCSKSVFEQLSNNVVLSSQFQSLFETSASSMNATLEEHSSHLDTLDGTVDDHVEYIASLEASARELKNTLKSVEEGASKNMQPSLIGWWSRSNYPDGAVIYDEKNEGVKAPVQPSASNFLGSAAVYVEKDKDYCFSAYFQASPSGICRYAIGESASIVKSTLRTSGAGTSVDLQTDGETITVDGVTCNRYHFTFSPSADGYFAFSYQSGLMLYRPRLHLGTVPMDVSVSESMMRQTAKEIQLEVEDEMSRAGIDITAGEIDMHADKFKLKNNNGEQVMGVDSNGDVEVSGTIMAKNLFRNTVMFCGGNYSQIVVFCSTNIHEEYGIIQNHYYTEEELEAVGLSYNSGGLVLCTGSADIVQMIPTTNGDGYSSASPVCLPRPEDFQNKIVEVSGWSRLNHDVDMYVSSAGGNCLSNAISFNNGFYPADITSQTTIKTGRLERFQSLYFPTYGRWLWVKISSE